MSEMKVAVIDNGVDPRLVGCCQEVNLSEKHWTEASEKEKEGYLGNRGDKADFLGDYLAVGTYTHKQALLTPNTIRLKEHHTSLTEEMEVPLILLRKRFP